MIRQETHGREGGLSMNGTVIFYARRSTSQYRSNAGEDALQFHGRQEQGGLKWAQRLSARIMRADLRHDLG